MWCFKPRLPKSVTYCTEFLADTHRPYASCLYVRLLLLLPFHSFLYLFLQSLCKWLQPPLSQHPSPPPWSPPPLHPCQSRWSSPSPQPWLPPSPSWSSRCSLLLLHSQWWCSSPSWQHSLSTSPAMWLPLLPTLQQHPHTWLLLAAWEKGASLATKPFNGFPVAVVSTARWP